MPTELRYTGIALGTNLGFAIFGGTAALVATWLITRTAEAQAATLLLDDRPVPMAAAAAV